MTVEEKFEMQFKSSGLPEEVKCQCRDWYILGRLDELNSEFEEEDDLGDWPDDTDDE